MPEVPSKLQITVGTSTLPTSATVLHAAQRNGDLGPLIRFHTQIIIYCFPEIWLTKLVVVTAQAYPHQQQCCLILFLWLLWLASSRYQDLQTLSPKLLTSENGFDPPPDAVEEQPRRRRQKEEGQGYSTWTSLR
jgi:hypothetical protein